MVKLNILMPVIAYPGSHYLHPGIVYLAGQVAEDSSLNAYEQTQQVLQLIDIYWKKRFR